MIKVKRKRYQKPNDTKSILRCTWWI